MANIMYLFFIQFYLLVIPGTSVFELRLAIRKLKTHISPCTDKIPAEMMQSEGGTVHSEIHKLTDTKRN
jgi:hypothetical protein